MRIIHPTDFSATADKARALAIDLADRTDGDLHLVHVQRQFENQTSRSYLQPSLEQMNPELLRIMREQQEEEVKGLRNRLASFATEAGDATWDLRWGEPLPELLEVAEGADLMVMGAHGDNPFDTYFLGGLAGRVVRRSTVPVVTVRQETPTTEVRRILVATDFGPSSRVAWSTARQLSDASDGAIKLMIGHVVEDHRLTDDPNYNETATDAMSDMAQGLAERHLLRSGNPVSVLPELAREVGADVIAIGVRRHAGALGLVLGSRADALLRSSPVPILSVPSS